MSTHSESGSSCTATNAALLERIRQVARSYKGKEGSLIQVLHMVQGVYGYLPKEVQQIVATELEIPFNTVAGVVSFYSFFTTEPRGKHTIRVCLGTACYVRGGVSVVEAIEKHLNVKVGHTTEDGMFTFEIARCIGACSIAPAMTIDNTMYPEVNPKTLSTIFDPWYKEEV